MKIKINKIRFLFHKCAYLGPEHQSAMTVDPIGIALFIKHEHKNMVV